MQVLLWIHRFDLKAAELVHYHKETERLTTLIWSLVIPCSERLVCRCTILCRIIFHFVSDSTAKISGKAAGAPPRQKNVYII